jgi:diguanylate cyclase (GGDEF)-like protein
MMMPQDNNLRILIIDDNPEIHKDFIKVLTANSLSRGKLEELEEQLFGQEKKMVSLPKFQIDTASQGQEGLEKIINNLKENKPYALAFVDIRMPPGWDGIETIKRIWEVDPDIQIVICTAYSDYTWEETIEQLGQRENLLILKKPFDHVTVRQLSCALTKKWQLLQESRVYAESLESTVAERTKLLQQSLSITRGTLESAADGILVIDSNNVILDYNNKLVDMWKITPAILETEKGTILLEHVSGQLKKAKEFLKLVKKLNGSTDTIKIDRLRSSDNRIFEHYSQSYKLNNKVAGRIWSFRDITNRALLEEKIQFQATHDMLTKLPNRTMLMENLHQAIAIAKRNNTYLGVLFFDIDRFKLINDSFNHAMGDQLLQDVAKRIKPIIRNIDTLVRWGGDEFVVLITLLHENSHLENVARKILQAFYEPMILDNQEIMISLSIGISLFPEDGKNADELLRNADTAMYRAKEYGGNQFQFYTPEIDKRNIERLEIEAGLHKAILNNEFILYYQPQIDASTNQLISVEALIRWKHPKKGIILPLQFIPIAEETGQISAIGEWVLKTACTQNKKWQDMGFQPIRVAVNVGAHQFKQPNFVDTIRNALKHSNLDSKYLELELTEKVVIDNLEAPSIIADLKEMGVKITLDDFGTGYSSLSYLRKIAFDRLKIDQSFIQNIEINKGDEVIIQAIISMGKDLNLEILAEGVENQKQLDFLKVRHCENIQGYYFNKPLPPDELEAFLC